MIKFVRVFLCTVVLCNAVQGQELTAEETIIDAKNVEVVYEEKARPAIAYTSDMDSKFLRKAWKGFLTKSYGISSKFKIANLMGAKSKQSNVIASKDITIEKVSDKRMDLYASISERGNLPGANVRFFAAFGYDIYIDEETYPTEYKSVKEIAETFLYNSTLTFYNEKTGNLSKKQASLLQKNESLRQNTQKNEQNIEKAKAKITELGGLSDDWYKSAKASKKIEKLQKKITTYKTKIETNTQTISTNEQTIAELKKEQHYFEEQRDLLKK